MYQDLAGEAAPLGGLEQQGLSEGSIRAGSHQPEPIPLPQPGAEKALSTSRMAGMGRWAGVAGQ